MATPAPADLFSRYMVAAFDEKEIIAVPTGFQAFFGNPMNGGKTHFSPDANQVDIDIIRGDERIAALIPRGTVSRSLGSLNQDLRTQQFSSFSRKFPLSEVEGNIDAGQLTKRLAGENPYENMTQQMRLRQMALNLHYESVRRTVRMFEVLAAQSILTGKQDAIIGTTNTDLQFDFRRNSNHNITVGTSWAGGSANILGDIDAACALIRANGKIMPDMMLMGSTAINSFVKDTTVKSLADNRRFEFIRVGDNNPAPPKFQRFITAGFIPQGKLRTPAGYELWMFSYLDVYTNSAGNPTKYLPDDKVVITSSAARFDRYFGPSEQLPMLPMRQQLYRELFGFDPTVPPKPAGLKDPGNIVDPAMFYCDAYVSGDWKRVTIRSQSAPIFATTHTDALAVMDTEP